MTDMVGVFDRTRIINLAARTDRRTEMVAQLARAGALLGPDVRFHAASRPADAGRFESVGARGCFESHLSVLTEARNAGTKGLLLLEDDLNFSRDVQKRAPAIFAELVEQPWSFFYGSHNLQPSSAGLSRVPHDQHILTAAFVGFNGAVLAPLVAFLELLRDRESGTAEPGPMHVDGAYAVFRASHPEYATFAAMPPLGVQRSSRSDIAMNAMILDQFAPTQRLAGVLRRWRNRLRA